MSANGVYTVSGGKIYDPSGARFLAAGLNIDNSVPASTILALFPHTRFVRVPMGSYDQPSQWEPLLTDLQNAGVVCEVEHHPWPLINALSGADLAVESAWYKTWAAYAIGKPRLWLGSMNEPQGGDLSAQHAATYAAIRGTGNENPIMLMCGVGGGNPGGVGAPTLNPATYTSMHGIIWDLHFYGWVVNSTDQARVNATLLGSVASGSGILAAQGITSADGVVPVIVGETGPSTASVVDDANAAEVEYAVTTWAWTQGHTQGWAGWHWDADQANALQQGGKLTAWGVVANAAALAVGASLPAAPATGGSTVATWQDGNVGGMAFKILLPDNYNAATAYPVVFYLHQLDMGTGGAVSGLMTEINPWFTSAAFRAHPAIVVAPLLDQSADMTGNAVNFGGVSPSVTAGRDMALAVLASVLASHKYDPARVYVTGNSLGGIGTWEMIAFKPTLFAAAMPLAGANYARDVNTTCAALKSKPIWAIHGGQDTSVPLAWDRAMAAQMKAIGGVMKYTEDASLGHDVWDTYYPQATSWNWLFQQTLKGATPVAAASANGTNITKSTDPAIIDATGASWTLTSGGQCAVGGAADTMTANVVLITYNASLVYQQNKAGGWWTKAQPTDVWATAAAPVVMPPSATYLTASAHIDTAQSELTKAKAYLAGLTP
jgi:poly(3-hydroxybutyrate) depolymerase